LESTKGQDVAKSQEYEWVRSKAEMMRLGPLTSQEKELMNNLLSGTAFCGLMSPGTTMSLTHCQASGRA